MAFDRQSVRYEPVQTTEQAGLEVVAQPAPSDKFPVNAPSDALPIPVATEFQSQQYLDPKYGQYGQAYQGGDSRGFDGYGAAESGGVGAVAAASSGKRICGLKRWVFFVILAVVVLVIAGGIGGGIAGGLLSSRSNNANGGDSNSQAAANSTGTSPTSSASAIPAIATPGTFAAVKASEGLMDNVKGITYFFQDINTPDIYMWRQLGDDWRQVGKLEGLNPPPRANSSIAAVQAPDQSSISLFYTADNGTLFDAIGTFGSASWRMGQLAALTNYKAEVAPGSGIAASWWGRARSSIRVYYVDSGVARIREVAYDEDKNPRWFITTQEFEQCSQSAKVAVAHLPPRNSTNVMGETIHLFYQDRNNNVRHYPGYNGLWDVTNAETIRQTTIPTDAYLAASINLNPALDYPLRLWYIDSSSRLSFILGEGQSIATDPNFQNLGTFGDRQIATSFPNAVVSNGQVPGGSLAVITWTDGDQARVYFQAGLATNNNRNAATEIALDDTTWQTRIFDVEAP
ncbi:hypothetical protein DRE_04830 [Drechslerella stenobrocha 248]|uniref:Uncharacterized protein n=1 Tax=Drechslerella stenobrocha 248 TaxID=1043628 RepID=W7I0N6_9PEZI|nr:hypothetical protein DRE_04830 [Drechslerella stenobrocha 248]